MWETSGATEHRIVVMGIISVSIGSTGRRRGKVYTCTSSIRNVYGTFIDLQWKCATYDNMKFYTYGIQCPVFLKFEPTPGVLEISKNYLLGLRVMFG